MDPAQLTTTALMDHVKADNTATERELALLDRLVGALDEIDLLQRELARAVVPELTSDGA